MECRGGRGGRSMVAGAMGLLAALLAAPSGAQTAPPASTPASRAPLQDELDRHLPEITAALRAAKRPLPSTRTEAEALGARLAQEGYRRLPDDRLLELLAMRGAIVDIADEPLCAAMWTGAGGIGLTPALALYLPEGRQRRWAQIAVEAQLAELRDQPARRPPPPPQALEAALGRLLQGLSAIESDALLEALQGRRPLSSSQRCQAAQLYYRGLRIMAPEPSMTLFRATLYQ